jgi:hypothetical protein
MEWVLRVVETRIAGQGQSADVMEISRQNDFRNIVNLSLTLTEAK